MKSIKYCSLIAIEFSGFIICMDKTHLVPTAQLAIAPPPVDEHLKTELIGAIYTGDVTKAKLLLKQVPDLALQYHLNDTPMLALAIEPDKYRTANFEIIEVLLNHGATLIKEHIFLIVITHRLPYSYPQVTITKTLNFCLIISLNFCSIRAQILILQISLTILRL